MPCVTSRAHRWTTCCLWSTTSGDRCFPRHPEPLSQTSRCKAKAPLRKKALKAGITPHTLELHHLPLSLHMDDGGEQHLLWARAGERLVLCPALCGAVASTTEYGRRRCWRRVRLLYNLLRLLVLRRRWMLTTLRLRHINVPAVHFR